MSKISQELLYLEFWNSVQASDMTSYTVYKISHIMLIGLDVIKAFNLTSLYLDDLLNIDNPYFEGMVNQIYPPELQLNKANTSDTEAPFLEFTSVYF